MRPTHHDILFEPIGPVTTRNRFYQVPHCTGMGYRHPRAEAELRGIKAEGGWGVVSTQETEIHPSSDLTPANEGRLCDERDIPASRRSDACSIRRIRHRVGVCRSRPERIPALGYATGAFSRCSNPTAVTRASHDQKIWLTSMTSSELLRRRAIVKKEQGSEQFANCKALCRPQGCHAGCLEGSALHARRNSPPCSRAYTSVSTFSFNYLLSVAFIYLLSGVFARTAHRRRSPRRLPAQAFWNPAAPWLCSWASDRIRHFRRHRSCHPLDRYRPGRPAAACCWR